jgi:hypothetical protein
MIYDYPTMFVPRKPFQPSLMFASKAGAYLSGEPLGMYYYGRVLASPENIRLGPKNCQGKHSSLIMTLIDYSHKTLYEDWPLVAYSQMFLKYFRIQTFAMYMTLNLILCLCMSMLNST